MSENNPKIIRDRMENSTYYAGKTILQHLEYIKDYDYEEQYRQVEKIKESVLTELKDINTKINPLLDCLYKSLNLDREKFQEDVKDVYIKNRLLIMIKENLQVFESSIYRYAENSVLMKSVKDELLTLYEFVKFIIPFPEPVIDFDAFYFRHPKDEFDKKLKQIETTIIKLEKKWEGPNQVRDTFKEILNEISCYPKTIVDSTYFINDALLELLFERKDSYKFSKFDLFEMYVGEAENLRYFLSGLSRQTINLKKLAELYSSTMLDSMKINWLGTPDDCAKLINFLIDKKIISGDKNCSNKFIVKHFLFKGKTKNNIQFSKRKKTEGLITQIGNVLKINVE